MIFIINEQVSTVATGKFYLFNGMKKCPAPCFLLKEQCRPVSFHFFIIQLFLVAKDVPVKRYPMENIRRVIHVCKLFPCFSPPRSQDSPLFSIRNQWVDQSWFITETYKCKTHQRAKNHWCICHRGGGTSWCIHHSGVDTPVNSSLLCKSRLIAEEFFCPPRSYFTIFKDDSSNGMRITGTAE
jgi:hypothetical protein